MSRDPFDDARNDETAAWPGALPARLRCDRGAPCAADVPGAAMSAWPPSHPATAQLDHERWEYFGHGVSLRLRFPLAAV